MVCCAYLVFAVDILEMYQQLVAGFEGVRLLPGRRVGVAVSDPSLAVPLGRAKAGEIRRRLGRELAQQTILVDRAPMPLAANDG